MKASLSITLLSVVLLLPLSCGIVQLDFEIGENGYRSLSPEQKNRIRNVDPQKLPKLRKKSAVLNLYEVNTNDIKAIAERSHLTWVHLWQPWCPNDNCVNIGYLEELHAPLKRSGLRFLMVSKSYEFHEIDKIVNNSGFPYPILVLENAHYGSKLKAAAKMFYNEIGLENTESWPDDLVFAGESLVFAGEIKDGQVLDSLNSVYSNSIGW